MSDAVQNPSISEDIAFIRALAVEGRKTPFRGEISLAAGLIWGSTSLFTWAVLEKLVGAPANIGVAWGGAAVLFAVAGFPLGVYRSRHQTNRIVATVWAGVGLACWTIVAATALAVWRTHQEIIITIIPAMIMALYGAGWMAGAVAFRQPWQRWIGVACLLVGVLLGATAGRPEEYLIFALALYGLMGLPGLLAVMRPRSNA
jgi:hypothetical protein